MEEPTNPGTPSTLAMLRDAQATLESARAALAKVVLLVEEVERTVRYQVEPLTRRVDELERAYRSRDTLPAPSGPPPGAE